MTLANKDLPDSEKQIFNQRTNDLHMKVDTDVKDFAVDKFNLGKLEGPVQTPEGKFGLILKPKNNSLQLKQPTQPMWLRLVQIEILLIVW